MHYQLLINGVLNDGASKLDVVNPATEQVFATAARADGTLLNEAVTAASRAFPAWSRTSAEGRRERFSRSGRSSNRMPRSLHVC